MNLSSMARSDIGLATVPLACAIRASMRSPDVVISVAAA